MVFGRLVSPQSVSCLEPFAAANNRTSPRSVYNSYMRISSLCGGKCPWTNSAFKRGVMVGYILVFVEAFQCNEEYVANWTLVIIASMVVRSLML